MREKILDLMQHEGLKPSQLAEMLGINPAGISHILAGRNKPGFDLLQKMLRRFPQISPDWLMLDAGPMYRPDRKSVEVRQPQESSQKGTLFESRQETPILESDLQRAAKESAASTGTTIPDAADIASGSKSAKVLRIIVCYDDHTFETYSPTLL